MRTSSIARWHPGGWLAEPSPFVEKAPGIPAAAMALRGESPQWRVYEIAERALLDQPTPSTLGQYAAAVRAILQVAVARLTTRRHQGRSVGGPLRQWVWVQEAEDQLKSLADGLRGLDATGMLRATGQLRGLLLNLWC